MNTIILLTASLVFGYIIGRNRRAMLEEHLKAKLEEYR